MGAEKVFHLPDLEATDRSELFDRVAEQLLAAGLVKPSWRGALDEREREFPTGLPLPGGVAIPHTPSEHVQGDALVVVTPSSPVEFCEMGGEPEDVIDASLVVFLVFVDGKAHLQLLSSLVAGLQNEETLMRLKAATDEDAVRDVLDSLLTN